jgi:hypothetical protein
MANAKTVILKLAAVALWCGVLFVVGGFPLYQAIMLGLVTVYVWVTLPPMRDAMTPFGRAMRVILPPAGIVICCLAFIFGGGFSISQGIMLGATCCGVYGLQTECAEKPYWKVSPHRVVIRPNWMAIRHDFKLNPSPTPAPSPDVEPAFIARLREGDVAGAEQAMMESVLSKISAANPKPPPIFVFTVLDRSRDLSHALIFADGRYRSSFRFESEVDAVQVERDTSIRKMAEEIQFGTTITHQNIGFFMRGSTSYPGVAAYDLGISVPKWWWARVKGSCPAPVSETDDHTTGYVELVLAAIPCSEFDLYWEPAEWSEEFNSQTSKRIAEMRDRDRQRLGWSGRSSGIDPGYSHIYYTLANHRYFNLTHNSV